MHNLKSVRSKLILGFILSILIPSLVIAIVLYNKSKSIVQEKIASTIIEQLEQKSDDIDNVFEDIYYKTISLSVDKNLIKKIENLDNNYGSNKVSDNEIDEISDLLSEECKFNKYLDSFYLFLPKINKIITSKSLRKVVDVPDVSKYQWISQNDNDLVYEKNWLSVMEIKDNLEATNKNFFSINKNIQKPLNSETYGSICANVDERIIYFNIFDSIKRDNNNIFILNSNGVVVSNQRYDNLYVDMSKEHYIEKILNSEKGYFIDNIGGVQKLVVYVTTKLTKYKIVYIIPENEIASELNEIKSFICNVAFISIIIGIILSLIFSVTIYKPIKKLKNAMERVGTGDFDIRMNEQREDEFGILNNGFNQMISKIQKLFNEVYVQKLLKKEAELNALQSQITPHFLYNTLNSIRCTALLQESTNISDMLGALIELLQLSAGKKSDFITIEEEIKQVKNYVLLQKFRYRDLFDVDYEVDDSILKYKVPKLILQPLVENSIKHGINLRSGEGRISIKVSKYENSIVLEVSDNGMGIAKEKIEQILSKRNEDGRRFSGIGVNNINDRIKIYFGDSYGLFYETKKERGTIAKILIPLSEGRNDIPCIKS